MEMQQFPDFLKPDPAYMQRRPKLSWQDTIALVLIVLGMIAVGISVHQNSAIVSLTEKNHALITEVYKLRRGAVTSGVATYTVNAFGAASWTWLMTDTVDDK